MSVDKIIARTALAAATAGCAALALASPASAEKYEEHLAVDCPKPYSQSCPETYGLQLHTTGPLFVTFTADGNPPSCAPGKVHIFINDMELFDPAVVQPGQNDGGNFINLTSGNYYIDVQMEGVLGGCNTGSMSGWSGTLHAETNADALNGATD